MKTLLFPFLFLILLSSLAAAVSITESYPNIGFNSYVQAGGKFNQNLFNPLAGNANTDGFSRPIAIPQGVPIVADLDGDGRNEIVIQNGADITLYQNKTLDIMTGLTLNFTPSSNIFVYDLDNDGRKEIILGNINNEIVDILEYNTTGAFGVQKAIGVNNSNYTAITELMVSCADVEKCSIITTGSFTSGTTRGRAQAMFFNSTSNGGNVVIVDGSAVAGATGTQTLCFPQIRGVETKDYDSDSSTEYIMTFIEGSVSLSETQHIVWFNQASPTSTTTEHHATQSLGALTATATCSAGIERFISPPLTFDATNAYAGMETIVAQSESTTTYDMSLFRSDGTNSIFDVYPQVLNVDGSLLSNVFRADALAHDGQRDFCILGGSPATSELNLLCGSAIHTVTSISPATTSAVVFDSSNEEPIPYNVSQAYGSQHIITHSTQQSNDPVNEGQSNFDADEIVTSFGIYRLEYGGDNVLRQLFAQPYGDASVAMIDVQKSGFADMLVLTNNSLWYIDDRFENTGAKITNITFNPCIINNVVMQNTTIQVTVIANDEQSTANEETDQVSTQVIGYFGDVNQQVLPWSLNASAFTPRQFTFNANSSITTGVIRIEAIDTGNPTSPDVVTQTFSVGTTGVEFGSGSCTTSFALVGSDVVGGVNVSRLPTANNSISNAMAGINEQFGLGSTVIWLILMVTIAIGIWMTGHESHAGSSIVFGLIMFVEFLLFMIGAYLGFISTAAVIVIIIVAVAIIGLLFIRPIISGSG